MSAEQSKVVVWRFYEELWNNRQLDLADELIAVGCVTHQLRSGLESAAVPRGPEAMKQHITEWLTGFPDLRYIIERIIAEDDLVVSQCVMRGTHTGPWQGLAPTGRPLSLRLYVTQRVAAGKIVEDWVLLESLGFLQQLGLIPATKEIFEQSTKRSTQ